MPASPICKRLRTRTSKPLRLCKRIEFEHWDTQFHQRLFAATRNELLVSIHGILQVIRSRNPWIELKRKSFSENRRLHYCEQHANVVAALENRDADGAAQAMLGHIEAIEIALFGRR